MDLIGGSKSKSRAEDLSSPQLATTRSPFASVLLSLLGAQGPQTGSVRGPGKDPTATVAPAGDPLAGIPKYTGETTAPIAANEQALLNALMTQGQQSQALLGQTLAGDFLTPDSNPFLGAYIEAAQRPTMQAYEEVLGRTLPGQFTQAGHRVQPGQSSPFDRAAAIQSRGLADALGDISTNISMQAYEAERQRQQQAIPLSQQEVQSTIQNLQAQALPRMIEQHGLDQGLALFQQQTTQLLQLLQVLSGVAQPALGTTSSSRQSTGWLPAVAGATGTAVGGLGAGGFFGGAGGGMQAPIFNPFGPQLS